MLPSCLPASCIRWDSSLVNFVSRTSLAFPVINANFPLLLNILVFPLFKTLSALTPHVFIRGKILQKGGNNTENNINFFGQPKDYWKFSQHFSSPMDKRQMWMYSGVKSTGCNLTHYSTVLAHTNDGWRDPTPTHAEKRAGHAVSRTGPHWAWTGRKWRQWDWGQR